MACLEGCVPLDPSTPSSWIDSRPTKGELHGRCMVEGLKRGVCPLTFLPCKITLGRKLGRGLALRLGFFKDLQRPLLMEQGMMWGRAEGDVVQGMWKARGGHFVSLLGCPSGS